MYAKAYQDSSDLKTRQRVSVLVLPNLRHTMVLQWQVKHREFYLGYFYLPIPVRPSEPSDILFQLVEK
jgi:hypothetical protein